MVKTFPLLIAIVVAGSAAGCASLSLPFGGGQGKAEVVHATQANPVMETITLWEPGEGRGLDNIPTRGFAGQVLFFTYKHPTPARVHGNVTVYVFDDQGTTEQQSQPLFQHTFNSQEWNSLSLQTNLGTAYQLFIPYTRKGTHTARCSLRVKFEPADGGAPVYSKMTNVVLEGDTSKEPATQLTRRRIEPKRFDADETTAMRQVPRVSDADGLRASSVSLPGRGRLSAQSAARLQQFAEQMVRTHRSETTGDVEQAAYFTPPADEAAVADDGADAATGSRYRLYR